MFLNWLAIVEKPTLGGFRCCLTSGLWRINDFLPTLCWEKCAFCFIKDAIHTNEWRMSAETVYLVRFFKYLSHCCVQNHLTVWPCKQINSFHWVEEACPAWISKVEVSCARVRRHMSVKDRGITGTSVLAWVLKPSGKDCGEAEAKGDHSSVHI